MSRIGTGASLQARSGRGAPCDAFREPTFRECRVSGLPSGRRRGHTGGVNSFVFDPRIWILPPYQTCPNCRRDAFGVLMIGGTSMVRRCRECFYDEQFQLPDVDKSIVYLDQMAISNMTKILHPELSAGRAIDPFWREMFERIDFLCKLQVLVCPDSQTHREESAVAPCENSS